MKAIESKADTSAESDIRALIDHWSRAMSEKDVDSLMEHYAEDVVAFDVPPPLQVNGRDAVRAKLDSWLRMFEGPVDVDFKDVNIITGGDLAVLHQLARVSDRRSGPGSGSWVRVTVVYQKIDGKWLVTHEHASLPFTGQSTVESPRS
jgi:uncharacterized protein (TIGR02246 family)